MESISFFLINQSKNREIRKCSYIIYDYLNHQNIEYLKSRLTVKGRK